MVQGNEHTKMMIVGYSSLSPANADTGLRYMVLNNVTEESRDTICTVQRSGQHTCLRTCVRAGVRAYVLVSFARNCMLVSVAYVDNNPWWADKLVYFCWPYIALYHDIGVGRTVKLSELLD